MGGTLRYGHDPLQRYRPLSSNRLTALRVSSKLLFPAVGSISQVYFHHNAFLEEINSLAKRL